MQLSPVGCKRSPYERLRCPQSLGRYPNRQNVLRPECLGGSDIKATRQYQPASRPDRPQHPRKALVTRKEIVLIAEAEAYPSGWRQLLRKLCQRRCNFGEG